jgi:flavin reductase (DIM6/NTAB) family NADH-FMN oxidoreductase RutF
MLTLDPRTTAVPKMHSYLLGAITPRPIAFASTVDNLGNVNLSPFSFFNCFGANPPILVFSPATRARDNTTKHTYENLKEVPEVVINVVNYAIVQQASLASTEYPKNVNEFIKAGLTAAHSEMVRPPRVSESPISMECKVLDIIRTGDKGGAGNLVICEILLMHIKEEVLDAEGKIDPYKLDAVARLGGDYYARVHGPSIFKVPKPLNKLGIGIDQLPDSIRQSKILTGNDLAILANVEEIPKEGSFQNAETERDAAVLMKKDRNEIHLAVKKLTENGNVADAWQLILRTEKRI